MIFGTLLADGLSTAWFFAFAIASWRFRISFDVSLVAGMALLLAAASSFAVSQLDFGVFLATLAFGFLVVGVVLCAAEQLVRASAQVQPAGNPDDLLPPRRAGNDSRGHGVRRYVWERLRNRGLGRF